MGGIKFKTVVTAKLENAEEITEERSVEQPKNVFSSTTVYMFKQIHKKNTRSSNGKHTA